MIRAIPDAIHMAPGKSHRPPSPISWNPTPRNAMIVATTYTIADSVKMTFLLACMRSSYFIYTPPKAMNNVYSIPVFQNPRKNASALLSVRIQLRYHPIANRNTLQSRYVQISFRCNVTTTVSKTICATNRAEVNQ